MSDQKTQYADAAHDNGSSPPSSALLSPRTNVSRGWLQIRQNAHRFWLLEAAASFLSLLMFASIVGVLLYFDDRIYGDATKNKGNMSKRPIIFPALAIMSAVMRATMLLPVATAIGQLKWSWFRSSRRLIDMERFDDAARGILGSAKLMLYLRFRNLAAIGAALTILALPLDAVIQSAVLMPSSVQPIRDLKSRSYEFDSYQSDTNFSRAISYTDFYQMTSKDDVWPSIAMMNAIQWGQSYSNGPSSLVGAPVKVDCPYGYCVFNTTQTLAVGHHCVRRTDIQYSPYDGTYAAYQTLPGTDIEFYLDGTDDLKQEWIVAASYSEFPNSTTHPGYPTNTYETDVFGSRHGPLIARTSMMFNSGGTADKTVDNGTIAIECGLFWSIKTYTIYVNETTDYEYYEENDSSATLTKYVDWATGYPRWVLKPSPCIVDGARIPARNDTGYDEPYYRDNCIFWIAHESHVALQKMLTDAEYGLVGNMSLIEQSANGTRLWNRKNSFLMNLDGATFNRTYAQSFRQIKSVWNNMAFAATATIRRGSSVQLEGPRVNLATQGTVSTLVFYYSIDWARLGMPGLIVLCCALFVLHTAFLTRKEYAWRRSALPLLFHGLEDQERLAQGDVRDFNVMQDLAKDIRVRLTDHVDANGARLTTGN